MSAPTLAERVQAVMAEHAIVYSANALCSGCAWSASGTHVEKVVSHRAHVADRIAALLSERDGEADEACRPSVREVEHPDPWRRAFIVTPPEADEVEALCILFHDAYEAAAVEAGWETQERSRKPWADVPEANKATMRAACRAVVAAGYSRAQVPDPGLAERVAAQADKWEESDRGYSGVNHRLLRDRTAELRALFTPGMPTGEADRGCECWCTCTNEAHHWASCPLAAPETTGGEGDE